MATHEIIIAGFGGQGVMAIGKTLAEAGMQENKFVSWLPSYGPEMRGGTANCHVVVSDTPVVSPIIINPTELIVMNKPSLIKFEPMVVCGGVVFINSSIVEVTCDRKDVICHLVPCNDLAAELGNAKVSNMVMLGAYIEETQLLKLETIHEMLRLMFTGKKASLVDLNIKALDCGAEIVRQAHRKGCDI